MQSLSQISYSEASYTEEKHIDMLDVPITRYGRLVYGAPDRLEWHQKQSSFIVRGSEVTIRNGDSSRSLPLDQVPRARVFIDSFRATLSGDLALLREHYALDYEPGEAGHWQIRLEPRDAALRQFITRIRLDGKGDRLVSVHVDENSGDWSVMKLETVRQEYHAPES